MELRSKSTFLHNMHRESLGLECKPEGCGRGRKAKTRQNVRDFGKTVEFISPTFACQFMSQLYQLYQQGICCDVVLSTGDYQTSAHKVVLMASSEYFKSLFLTPDIAKDFVVLPSDVSSEAFKSMISYMYTGVLYLNAENVQLMLSAAERLFIKSAVELCNIFLGYSGMHLDSSLSLLSGGANVQLDQVSDVVIKEEISSIEEAEIESKFQTPDLHEMKATGNSFTAVHQIDPSVNGMSSKRRTKPHLNEKNNEVTEDALEMNTRPTRRFSKRTSISESRKTIANSRARVPKSGTKLRCNSSTKVPKSSTPCGRAGRGPYVKNCRTPLINSPIRDIFTRGQTLLASGVKYNCNICNVGFHKYSGLVVHLKFIHQVLPLSMAVRACRKLLQLVILRVRHSLPCELYSLPEEGHDSPMLSCSYCHRALHLRGRLLAHLLKCHPTKHPVIQDRKKTSFGGKVRQNRLVRAQVHKCKFCGRPFAHESTLATHCLLKHKRIKREPCTDEDVPRVRRGRSTWSCKEIDCGMICSCVKELKKHMAAKHPNVIYSCPDCRFSCQVERVFQRHRNQRHVKIQVCDLCGKTFPKLCLLKQHMYLHHGVKDPTLKLYQCPFEGCTYECCAKNRFADHCSRHKLGKSLKCDECGKAFKHKLGLKKHVNTIHHGIRPFICDQCGMGFGSASEVKTHMTQHSKNKPYSCPQCAYRASAKATLQHHLFSRHKIQMGLGEQKLIVLKCDQCDFTTSRKFRLDDHMKKHQNIRDIPCPECGKLFITKRSLYGHTVTAHRPKTLQCRYCNYSSTLPSALKYHVRIVHTHRHEKEYECPICRFRSATSGNCRKHIQHTHKEFQVNPKYVGAPRMSDAFRAGKEEPPADEAKEHILNLSCKGF